MLNEVCYAGCMTTLNEAEQKLADKIDGELRFLAPERSVGEYLIEKGYVEVPEDDE